MELIDTKTLRAAVVVDLCRDTYHLAAHFEKKDLEGKLMRFSFDPSNNGFFMDSGSPILPAAVLIIVCVIGIICILSERKKAKGHWGNLAKFR